MREREIGAGGHPFRRLHRRPPVQRHDARGDQCPGTGAAGGKAGGDKGRVETQGHSAARLMKPPDWRFQKRA